MHTRIALALLIGISIAVIALDGRSGAEAQANNAVIRVEVRYPNGQLVTDTQVCSYVIPALLDQPVPPERYTNATFFPAGHRLDEPSGPTSDITVPGGEQYVVFAHSCPWANDKFMSAYNFGPGGPWGVGSNHKAINSIAVSPGDRKTVVLTVGQGQLSGRFDGLNSCGVSVFGVPDFGDQRERQFGKGGAPSAISTTYFAAVPPGRYRVRAVCNGEVMHYPPGSTRDTARYFRVNHGQTIGGLDFPQVTVAADADFARFQVADSAKFLSFCTETWLADGSLYYSYWTAEPFNRDREEHLNWARHADSIYQIRITDCMGLGFADVWYPNTLSKSDAQWLTAGEELTEIVDILGIGGPRCNGERATILGNGGDNALLGTAERDVIVAGAGNDTITALGGDDVVCAGDGDDRIYGNAGHDWIDAGDGHDWVGGGWGNDTVYGGAGNDFINGFKHDDFVDGGTGNDRIRGGWGNDVLRGGAGNDVIRAYYGADRLFGGAGNDVLLGSYGPDFIIGGPGIADRIDGEQGTRDECNDVGAETRFNRCELVNGQ